MDALTIAGKEIGSRLLIGTGKFSSTSIMKSAIEASGAEIVTVAMRRVDIKDQDDEFLSTLANSQIIFMPNTSGARDADEAVRLAQLGRAATGSKWIKVEIHPEPRYLLPDPIETLECCKRLVKEGFIVLPYINADPVLACRLEEVGCAAVMPLAAPIGSNRGIEVKAMLEIIIEQVSIPVIVDAGLGAPSHAALAMELGADAVLVNTAIAVAKNPIAMAAAFKMGVEAGRAARLAGLASHLDSCASATSPLTAFLQ